MRKGILYCLLPAVTGLALILVAVLLSSSSPGRSLVPSVQAQDPQECHFTIRKEEVDEDEVDFDHLVTLGTVNDGFDGDAIFYKITIKNLSDFDCGGEGEVVDEIDGGECVDTAVLDDDDLIDDGEITDYCGRKELSATLDHEEGDFAYFEGFGVMEAGGEVELLVVVEPDERYGCVVDEACLVAAANGTQGAAGLIDGDSRLCDQEVTCNRRHVNTPTPTPKPTSTPAPTNTPLPPAPTPTAKPLATIAPPPTGSGSSEGGWSPLTLALAMTGGCLLLVSGGALARKRIR
jgi:hypothetical protein